MRLADVPRIAFTEEQRRFRQTVRAFFASERVRALVAEIRHYPPDREPDLLDIYRDLGRRGWLAANWPVRYGGLGKGAVEAAIVTEEMTLAGVPDDVHVLAIDIVGMFVLRVGTEEQKRWLLPRLARGEALATVLFTEPDCGSDLASIRTRAEPAGDGWRLYGTKIYNQKSQFAEFGLCAARTHTGAGPWGGITLFLLPLRSPGVTIRPVENLTNDRFNEIVIDGIRLTGEDVVGEVGDGWRLINELLVLERTGIDFHAKARHWFGTVAQGTDDPELAYAMAELDGRLRASHALSWRIVAALDRGAVDPVLAAMAKWSATALARDVVRLCLDVLGMPGLLSAWDAEPPHMGLIEAACRQAPALTLASGTTEIMLYVIASAGLDLL